MYTNRWVREANKISSKNLSQQQVPGPVRNSTSFAVLTRVQDRVLGAGTGALGWDWGSGLLGTALLQSAELAGERKSLAFVKRWIDGHLETGTPVHDRGGRLWKLGPGVCVVELWRRTHRKIYRERLLEMLRYLHESPRLAGGILSSKEDRAEVWVDSLMTLCPFLVHAWADGFAPHGLDEAVRQIELHADFLQDKESGLWWHAADVPTRRPLGHFWARGNGWAIFALVETLEANPPSSRGLRLSLRRTVEGLLASQRADGTWPTVLDHPETCCETSGQAMIVHGLARASRLRLIPSRLAARAVAAARRGWIPLTTHVADSGEVTGVSLGTSAGDLATYAERPTASWPVWGPAAFLLAAAEIERALRAQEPIPPRL